MSNKTLTHLFNIRSGACDDDTIRKVTEYIREKTRVTLYFARCWNSARTWQWSVCITNNDFSDYTTGYIAAILTEKFDFTLSN